MGNVNSERRAQKKKELKKSGCKAMKPGHLSAAPLAPETQLDVLHPRTLGIADGAECSARAGGVP